ncbi:MAG: hypothetical protein JNL58_01845 [Planctomyces sp.]|nr:hypothetical protein [Planctomyces sp.]
MSFHESYMQARFLLGCIASAILPFLLLAMPGVERWRVIPAFAFSGILFWIYFRTKSGTTPPESSDEPPVISG